MNAKPCATEKYVWSVLLIDPNGEPDVCLFEREADAYTYANDLPAGYEWTAIQENVLMQYDAVSVV